MLTLPVDSQDFLIKSVLATNDYKDYHLIVTLVISICEDKHAGICSSPPFISISISMHKLKIKNKLK